MAERAIPTALLFQTVSKKLKGDVVNALTHLGLSKGDMSAMNVDTIKFATEVTREAVTPSLETVTKTDDTVVQSKSAWKPGAVTIYGAGMFTAVTGDLLQVFHEWAASVAFESDDEVTQTLKIQSKQGS